jgi:hypothetical protein
VFSSVEEWLVDRITELEDQRERIAARLDAEQARGAGASTIVGLSGELRRLGAAVADLLGNKVPCNLTCSL